MAFDARQHDGLACGDIVRLSRGGVHGSARRLAARRPRSRLLADGGRGGGEARLGGDHGLLDLLVGGDLARDGGRDRPAALAPARAHLLHGHQPRGRLGRRGTGHAFERRAGRDLSVNLARDALALTRPLVNAALLLGRQRFISGRRLANQPDHAGCAARRVARLGRGRVATGGPCGGVFGRRLGGRTVAGLGGPQRRLPLAIALDGPFEGGRDEPVRLAPAGGDLARRHVLGLHLFTQRAALGARLGLLLEQARHTAVERPLEPSELLGEHRLHSGHHRLHRRRAARLELVDSGAQRRLRRRGRRKLRLDARLHRSVGRADRRLLRRLRCALAVASVSREGLLHDGTLRCEPLTLSVHAARHGGCGRRHGLCLLSALCGRRRVRRLHRLGQRVAHARLQLRLLRRGSRRNARPRAREVVAQRALCLLGRPQPLHRASQRLLRIRAALEHVFAREVSLLLEGIELSLGRVLGVAARLLGRHGVERLAPGRVRGGGDGDDAVVDGGDCGHGGCEQRGVLAQGLLLRPLTVCADGGAKRSRLHSEALPCVRAAARRLGTHSVELSRHRRPLSGLCVGACRLRSRQPADLRVERRRLGSLMLGALRRGGVERGSEGLLTCALAAQHRRRALQLSPLLAPRSLLPAQPSRRGSGTRGQLLLQLRLQQVALHPGGRHRSERLAGPRGGGGLRALGSAREAREPRANLRHCRGDQLAQGDAGLALCRVRGFAPPASRFALRRVGGAHLARSGGDRSSEAGREGLQLHQLGHPMIARRGRGLRDARAQGGLPRGVVDDGLPRLAQQCGGGRGVLRSGGAPGALLGAQLLQPLVHLVALAEAVLQVAHHADALVEQGLLALARGVEHSLALGERAPGGRQLARDLLLLLLGEAERDLGLLQRFPRAVQLLLHRLRALHRRLLSGVLAGESALRLLHLRLHVLQSALHLDERVRADAAVEPRRLHVGPARASVPRGGDHPLRGHRLVLDAVGALRVAERGERLFAAEDGGRERRDDAGLAAPAEALLQQASQLGVAVRDAALLLAQRRDDATQRQQGLVDVHRLAHARAVLRPHARGLGTLAARQVDHVQLAHARNLHPIGRLLAQVDGQREEAVRAGRLLVHLGLSDLAAVLGCTQDAKHVLGGVDLVREQTGAVDALALLAVIDDGELRARLVRWREEIVKHLVVDLEIRDGAGALQNVLALQRGENVLGGARDDAHLLGDVDPALDRVRLARAGLAVRKESGLIAA
mmetsp:Transcript_40135/g.131136  ORF Transcript_40135/g.131136 Transcript_40135/m.131136 type:complete len:1240 (+) Transcript_40135:1393-5112(+)